MDSRAAIQSLESCYHFVRGQKFSRELFLSDCDKALKVLKGISSLSILSVTQNLYKKDKNEIAFSTTEAFSLACFCRVNVFTSKLEVDVSFILSSDRCAPFVLPSRMCRRSEYQA